MTKEDAVDVLREISTEGTQLNVEYKKWIQRPIAQKVIMAMILTNTVEQVASEVGQTPGVGENSAATTLGYITGRSRTLDQLQLLDRMQFISTADPEESFLSPEQIEQGEV